jgi:hypothetical protein
MTMTSHADAPRFCPLGSVDPISCSPLSYCPEGAAVERFMAPLAACILADILLVLAIWMLRRRDARRATNARQQRQRKSNSTSQPTSEGHATLTVESAPLLLISPAERLLRVIDASFACDQRQAPHLSVNGDVPLGASLGE